MYDKSISKCKETIDVLEDIKSKTLNLNIVNLINDVCDYLNAQLTALALTEEEDPFYVKFDYIFPDYSIMSKKNAVTLFPQINLSNIDSKKYVIKIKGDDIDNYLLLKK